MATLTKEEVLLALRTVDQLPAVARGLPDHLRNAALNVALLAHSGDLCFLALFLVSMCCYLAAVADGEEK